MIGFFEDIEIGTQIELGTHTFTREEIVSFASRFDPQPFHLDAEMAEGSLFGGLCASGWHTGSVWLRKVVENRQQTFAKLKAAGEPVPKVGPSPGVRDLKWLKPVYVDDTITFRSTVVDKKNSRSRPDFGLLISRHEGINQHGETVISLQGSILIERRLSRA